MGVSGVTAAPAIDEVLIEARGEELRAAALADGELVEVAREKRRELGGLGSVYAGRVTRRAGAMRAVFVEIGRDRPALMDTDDPPAEGATVIVQLIEPENGDKAARVTRRIALEGRYLVLLPGGKGVALSRRLPDKEQRERLNTWGLAAKLASEGLIVRAAAVDAAAPELQRELAALRAHWETAGTALRDVQPPALALDEGDGLARLLRRYAGAVLPRFVMDDALLAKRAAVLAARMFGAAPAIEVESGEALFDRRGVAEILESTTQKRLALKSGGVVWIEPTTALVAIDVDSGGASLGGAEAMLRVNLEAAAEIGRQVRLRDLGGVIAVDFLKLEAKTARAKVEAALARAVAPDRVPIQLVGWTRTGLFEMIRPRIRSAANPDFP